MMRINTKPHFKSCKLLSMLLIPVLMMVFSASLYAQGSSTKITGVVKDSKGETLIGVSILLKGTKTGTASDGDGKFSISVPDAQAVLVFTYIGFATKEVVVGNQKTLNVTLTENAATSLNEVVVTGYGQTVKKRDLTSAISSVSAKEIEERQPINLFDALQGQAAGVLVVNDGGEPGAEGSITVRGPSTFSAEGQSTNPLYVIDGVITPNAASINPSDIQSIEVLKDAASAAIYGSRSANGVILITTKHGVPNKPRIDAQFVYTIGQMAHKVQETNPADLRYYRRLQTGLTPGYGSTLVDSLNPGQNSDNDLEQLILGTTSHKSDAKISLAGGTKDLAYAMSLNYLDDQGTLINTYTKKLQSRINADYQFLKFMKYSTNLSFMRQTGNYSNIGNQIRPAFDRPSSYIIYYPNGDLASFINGKRNPIANATYEINNRDDYRTQFVNTLAVDITKDLRFTATLNAQYDNSEGIFFSPRFVNAADGASNAARNSFISRFFYEAQAYANYNKVINKNHTITATIGVSRDRARLDTTNLSGTNFVLENVHTVTGGNITNVLAQRVNFAAISTGSYFARLGYNYKSRYIAQFVYRNDASSRFGLENRSAGFPAGSIAWRFTDEPFMKWTNKALDDGKLRFSYGAGGNDAAGPYDAIPQVETGVNSYNGVAGISATANEPNPSLKWETTIIKDLGIDLTILKSRLTLTADAYIRTTNDLLYNAQVPKETGYTVQRVNVGTIENKGLEIVLAGTPVVSKNFNWTVNANISFERGKIVSLNKGDSFVAAGSGGVSGGNARFLVAPGERIGNFYGWKNLGVYQYDASNAYTPDGQKLTPVGITAVTSNRGGTAGATVATSYTLNGDTYNGTIVKKKSSAGAVLLGGDTEWQDTNNDGVIDDADRVVLGNAQPNVYLGFVNNFTYKRFSLSFIINATLGGKVYNQFKQNLTNFANTGGPSLPEAIYGAWTTQGDIARYPYYPDKDTRGSQRIGSNSQYLEDGSFIRLSSARFTYRLEPKFAQKIYAKNLALYVYGVNLLTYTNYTGFDPEFSPSSPLTPGDDTGRYPKRRELGFGINVGF